MISGLASSNKKLTRRTVAANLPAAETDTGFKPDARPIEKTYERVGCVADRSRHARDLIEGGVGQRIENVVLQQRLEPLRLVMLHGR